MSNYIEIRIGFDRSILNIGHGLCLSESVVSDIATRHTAMIINEVLAYGKQITDNLENSNHEMESVPRCSST